MNSLLICRPSIRKLAKLRPHVTISRRSMGNSFSASDFLLPLGVTLGGNVLLYFYCQKKKDNSLIDAFWGITFVTPHLAIWAKKYFESGGKFRPDPRSLLIFGQIATWAARLYWHIMDRHKGEDWRYQNWRKEWTADGTYPWRSFLQIFALQGFFSVIVNSSALYTNLYSNTGLGGIDTVGAIIWTIGFLFETVGDAQLRTHLNDQSEGKKKFIDWGLWRYTRHPNYFGEALMWWGIFTTGCAVPGGWKMVFAPACITWLLRYVSGVPMLEEKYKGNPEWESYCRRNPNIFFPWFPKN